MVLKSIMLRYKQMTSAILQIIAIICMVIDHVGLYFFDGPDWMRAIGRVAMPLFAMGIVEGFLHTKSRPKYLLRLTICAIVADIPHILLNNMYGYPFTHVVLFGFILGFLAMLCLEKKGYWWILTPFLVIAGSGLSIDYGFPVVLLIILFYWCRKKLKKEKIYYYSALLASLAITMGIRAAIANWPLQLWAIAAFIPLALYNGKKGHRLPKYAGYVFFPAHLLIIWLIKYLFLN